MLKVFIANISDLPITTEGLCLSDYRLSRLDKLSLPEKRRQSIGVELLLNYAVKTVCPEAEIPLCIDADEHGKPMLKNIPFFISLSHSGVYAACAISDSEVGLDIEAKAEYKPAVVKRFFTSLEADMIDKAEDKNFEFAKIWTSKECGLKYTGQGLSRSLKSVQLMPNGCLCLEPENILLNLFHKHIMGLGVSVCTILNADEISFECVDI